MATSSPRPDRRPGRPDALRRLGRAATELMSGILALVGVLGVLLLGFVLRRRRDRMTHPRKATAIDWESTTKPEPQSGDAACKTRMDSP